MLTQDEEDAARAIVNSAYLVHKTFGPGLLENIYEVCLCHELEKAGFKVERQLYLPVNYDGLRLDAAFRLDILVQGMIICEIKAVDAMHPIYEAQLLSYLKLTNKRLGFLINFNVRLIKEGIKRMVL
jgi:GxxExxY protein